MGNNNSCCVEREGDDLAPSVGPGGQSLTEDEHTDPLARAYMLDNRRQTFTSKGMQYRYSKNFEDRVPDDQFGFAPWDSVVVARDEGDGWCRVGKFFLPSKIGEVQVLTPMASPSTSSTKAEDSGVVEPVEEIVLKVTKCGMNAFLGLYAYDSSEEGRARFRKTGGGEQTCDYKDGCWRLSYNFNGVVYKVGSTNNLPPSNGWVIGVEGRTPPPQVVCYHREAPPTRPMSSDSPQFRDAVATEPAPFSPPPTLPSLAQAEIAGLRAPGPAAAEPSPGCSPPGSGPLTESAEARVAQKAAQRLREEAERRARALEDQAAELQARLQVIEKERLLKDADGAETKGQPPADEGGPSSDPDRDGDSNHEGGEPRRAGASGDADLVAAPQSSVPQPPAPPEGKDIGREGDS